MLETDRLSMAELEAGMEYIRKSPREVGVVMLIVLRPRTDEREVVNEAQITIEDGLVGDNWKERGSANTADGSPRREAQITLMNARSIALIAQSEQRWSLAGDQLYVDFDLSDDNIPPGTRLAIGSAVVEVSSVPHTGCKKFSARFGLDAMKFVNSPEGKQLHLRGINTKVIQSGIIHAGDMVQKISE
jgi:MOSC domain-containing protein YiiM